MIYSVVWVLATGSTRFGYGIPVDALGSHVRTWNLKTLDLDLLWRNRGSWLHRSPNTEIVVKNGLSVPFWAALPLDPPLYRGPLRESLWVAKAAGPRSCPAPF